MQASEWLRLNRFVDVKGNDNTWKVGKVTKIEEENATINFDGWSTYSSTYPISSKRLAPFRRFTVNYTGMAITKRPWGLSEEEMASMERKVKKRLEKGLLCKDAYETTQFYRGELFIFLENLIEWDFTDCLDVLDRVVSFFTDVIQLIVKVLETYPQYFAAYYQGLDNPDLSLTNNQVAFANTWPEVMETLNKLLAMETRCRKFFLRYHTTPKDYVFSTLTIQKENYSGTFLYLLNLFVSLNGLENIIKIVNSNSENTKVPINFLSSFTLYSLKNFIENEYFDKFAEMLSNAVIQRIDLVNEKDLKLIDSDTIVALLQSQREGSSKIEESRFQLSKLRLYSKMLKSSFMEKRVKGINEISGFLELGELRVISDDDVLKIFDKEGLLDDILVTRAHVEILKRSSQILQVFAKRGRLGTRECEIIWGFSQDKQKMMSDAGFLIITEIAPWLDSTMQDYFYNNLTSFPDSSVNLQAITEFSIKILEQHKVEKIYGLQFLYNMILDSSESNRWKESTELLVKIYSSDKAFALKQEFLASLVIKLQQLFSNPQYLSIALGIFKSLTKEQIIEVFASENIKISLLQNMMLYIKTVKELHSKVKNNTYYSKFTHLEQIMCRLELMEFVFNKTEFAVSLSKKEFTKLWTCFVKTPACKTDSILFYKSINSGVKFGPLINNFSEIFNSFFLDNEYFNAGKAMLASFKAFKFFFFKSNSETQIKLEGSRFNYVVSVPLTGLEKIVDMLLEGDDRVAESSIKLLKSLLTYYSNSISHRKSSKYFTAFLNVLMGKLKAADFLMINRALDFFIQILDIDSNDLSKSAFYLFQVNKYTELALPLQVSVRYIRKAISAKLGLALEQVAFKIADVEFTHIYDRKIIRLSKDKPIVLVDLTENITEFQDAGAVIAKNSRVLKFIFTKAVYEKDCKEKAWIFLSKLPENTELHQELLGLEKEIGEIMPENDFEFLYSLYTVKSLCEQPEWVGRFGVLGQEYINRRYVDLKIVNCVSLLPKQEEVIVHVLQKVLVNEKFKKDVLKAVFQTICDVTSMSDQLENPILFICQLESIVNFYCMSEEATTSEVCKEELGKVIEKLMATVIEGVGSKAYLSTLIIILQKLVSVSGVADDLLRVVWSFKQQAIGKAKLKHFWRFISSICECPSASPSLLSLISKEISDCDLPTLSESSKSEINIGLWGLLTVQNSCTQKTLITSHASSVFFDLLIQEHSQVPRCKHRETREIAYEYLISLLIQQPHIFPQILSYIDTNFYRTLIWRNGKYRNWHLSIGLQEKSKLGYVGLENPGCVCYMNSLFQQLFQIKTFSDGLLQLQTEQENTALFQLKNIFAKLKYSDCPFVSPRKFCKNFKDYEGKSANMFEQMDADEFFGRLMEKMEEDLKVTSEQSLIKNHFGGTQAVEMISKDCAHRNERLELMLSVPLDVKNKTGLEDSLKSLVNGELLQGENAYFCEACGKKVTALMRTSLKYMPNFLVFALRRFEFNFDTMNRNKIDDRFEFPFEINMKEYTTEFLNQKKLHQDSYYEYKLKGAVIHHGKAEQGHYFSYISNGDVWYEFNDTIVSVINQEIVKNNGFGQNSKTKIIPTAYLLIYERNEKFKYNDQESSMDLPTGAELVDFAKIQSKNVDFCKKKQVLSHDFLHFNYRLLEVAQVDCAFVLKFFMTVLIRIERNYKEKMAVFKYIASHFDIASVKILLDTITSENGIKEFLLCCPNPLPRKLMALLVKAALDHIDQATLEIYFSQYLRMVKYATKAYSNYFTHYLEILKYFSEKLVNFTFEKNLINLLIKFLLGNYDDFPITDYADENHLGYTKEYLMVQMKMHDSYGTSALPILLMILKFRNLISPDFLGYITSQPGYEALLQVVDSKAARRAYAGIYRELLSDDLEKSINFALYLLTRYLEAQIDSSHRYIAIFSLFINKHIQRILILKHIIDFYTDSIPQQNPAETQQLIGYLFKILNGVPYIEVSDCFTDEKINIIKSWLFQNMRSKFNEEIVENPLLVNFYNKICKVKEDENYEGNDSDDEFPEKCLGKDGDIFVYDSGRKQWLRGIVEDTIGKEILLIQYISSGTNNYVLKDVDYEEVYPRLA